MLKRILCTLIAVTAVCTAFTGCGPAKTETTTVVNTPSQEVKGDGHTNDNLDLKLCCENVENRFREGNYGLNDISIEPPTEDNNFFNIILVAQDKPDDNNVYIDLAKKCLNELNNEAIKQDPEFDAASDGYYGGLFDQYSINITATCFDEIITKWTINQMIEAGKHDPIVTNDDIIDLNSLEQ